MVPFDYVGHAAPKSVGRSLLLLLLLPHTRPNERPAGMGKGGGDRGRTEERGGGAASGGKRQDEGAIMLAFRRGRFHGRRRKKKKDFPPSRINREKGRNLNA